MGQRCENAEPALFGRSQSPLDVLLGAGARAEMLSQSQSWSRSRQKFSRHASLDTGLGQAKKELESRHVSGPTAYLGRT